MLPCSSWEGADILAVRIELNSLPFSSADKVNFSSLMFTNLKPISNRSR